jgi:hypothetical protein
MTILEGGNMKRIFTLVLLACLLITLLLFKVHTTKAALPVACKGWSLVPSPNSGNHNSILSGVSADSSSDAWAIGFDQRDLQEFPLIEHWNGTVWSIVPTHHAAIPSSITAIAMNDVWMAGYGGKNAVTFEHWNGTQWSIVPSPTISSAISSNMFLSAVSTNDIWAAGSKYFGGTTYKTLIEHWNGTKWSIVSGLHVPGKSNMINDVQAISTNDVWAIGRYLDNNSVYHTILEHWNGTNWSITPGSDQANNNDQYLPSLAALSDNNIWAAGSVNGSKDILQTLVEHWDGSKWSVVSSPNLGSGWNQLFGIAALSTNDIWAVGSASLQTLTEHWNGTKWSVIPSINPAKFDTSTAATVVPGTSHVWMVGQSSAKLNAHGQTLTELSC